MIDADERSTDQVWWITEPQTPDWDAEGCRAVPYRLSSAFDSGMKRDAFD